MTVIRRIVERHGHRYCEWVGRLLVAVAAAAALAAGVASGAIVRPTGDHAASAFYKQQADKYALLPGARIVETGYFFGRPIGTSVSYMWGHPPASGYRPEKAEILARLYRGRIVAYLATLTAPKMRRVRVVMAGSSVYVTSGKCWNKAGDASSPLGTGQVYLFNDGGTHFLPLVKNPSSKTTIFTYTWATGATARESNTFSAGPRPTVKTSITVTGSQHMTVEKTITPLTTAPELPVPPPPAQPQPKPLCGSK
jgi:hypothetical protein